MGMKHNQIFVTNKNKEPHVDRYDGEEFLFNPGERVMISIDAAVHLFGYGLENKTETLVRLGWASKYDPATRQFVEDKDGVRRLARFVFDAVSMVPASTLQPQAPEPEIA